MIDPKKYPPLNLPVLDAKVRMIDEVVHIFDPIRKKYVALTPEEWVRQHFVQFLTQEKGYPSERIRLEFKLNYHGLTKRPDIAFYDLDGKEDILVECKAPDVALTEDVFLQIATYFSVCKARLLILTNGIQHIYAAIQPKEPRIVYMKELSHYK